ncbi:MAG: hypothetical protein RL011_811 [Pseudomonadota bacterium]
MRYASTFHWIIFGLTSIAVSTRLEAAEPAQIGESVYRSAYFLGRGDTGIAEADREDAVFYNPAGIAQGTGIYKKTVLVSPQFEFSQGVRDVAKSLSNSTSSAVDTVKSNIGKPISLGFQNFTGLVLRRAALGLVASSHLRMVAFNDPDSGGLQAVNAEADQTLGATFTLAEKFLSDHLLVGVTAKYLQRGRGGVTASAADIDTIQSQLDDQSKFLGYGFGSGADIGFMYKIGGKMNPSLGLVFNDVGDTQIKPKETTEQNLNLLQTINLGLSLEPGTLQSKIKLLFDYKDITGRHHKNPYERTHLGAEISVWNRIGVTGGLSQGYPTFGFYTDIYILRLDVGTYAEETSDYLGLRPDRRYFFRLIAGF